MKYLKKFTLFEDNSPLLNLTNNTDFELLNLIESFNPITILEISCGNGSDAIELSNRGYKISATDLNAEYVAQASKYIDCIQHDTRHKFPFEDNSFDLVYSRLGLHYFDKVDLEKIFQEISRITKKYLIFTVKLVDDIPTGKVILDKKDWEELTSKFFTIISSEVKTGLLYNNQSKWLEVTCQKIY